MFWQKKTQGYYAHDFPNAGGLEIPLILGLKHHITAFISASRGYKQYISKQIDLPDIVINTEKTFKPSGIVLIWEVWHLRREINFQSNCRSHKI